MNYPNGNTVEIEKKVYDDLCWDKRHNLKLSLVNEDVQLPYSMVIGSYF